MAEGAFDTVKFKKALETYSKASSKDFAAIVNKVATEACFKARPKIPLMKLPKLNQYKPSNRTRKNYKGRLMYALAAKRGAKKGAGMQEAAEKMFNRRKSAKGYMRLQLLGAAKDLGANVRTKLPSPKSGAAEAHAEKATNFKLWAMIHSGKMNDRGLDMLTPAYADALQEAAAGMKKYAESKMAKTAKAHSSL